MRKISRNIVILLCVMLMLAVLPASILADVEENAPDRMMPVTGDAALSHDDALAVSGVAVSVATVTSSAGETVTVPVSIVNNTGFAGFTFEISCDEGLSLVDMKKGDLLMKSSGGALTKNLNNGQVNWTDIYNLYEDGELLLLTVKISENAAYGDYGIYVALKGERPTNFVTERGVPLDAQYLSGGITVGHNHTYTVESVTQPTCTEKGYTVYVCECMHSYIGEYIDALGHDIIDHEAKTPTCTEVGWDAYETCGRCDYTTYAEKAALGHAYNAVITAPTCTNAGYTTYTCSNGCQHSYQADIIQPLNHDITTYSAKEVTCTEAGWDAYESCSRCDYTTYAEKPALGHDISEHAAKKPTCTEDGWDAYETCGRCDYTTFNKQPATGHAYKTVVIAPTCTEAGFTTYTCGGCQDSYRADELPALGHDVTAHEAKEVTCTEAGWDAYESCSRCDYTTISEKPALGHDITEHAAKEVTCTEAGWDAYETCGRCDYTTFEKKPATGHSYKVVVTAPTCTEAGFTTYTCGGCQDSYRADELPALGHNIASYEAKEPTCTDVGWDAYEACSRCDYTTFVGKTSLGHDLVSHEAKDATCTEIGWDAYVTCSRCDYTTYTERTALGHNYEEGVCDRCGKVDPDYIPECPGGEVCPAKANNYTDVLPTDHWAHTGIDYCILNGYMKGTAPGIFNPQGTLSRAEFVTILYRIAGEPNAAFATYRATFVDVPNNTWYTDAIEWAAAEGYVKGIGGGRFDPEGKITREQILTILYRYSGEPEMEGDLSEFPDYESVSDFAVDAMIWATREGIIKGAVSNGVTMLAPLQNATREQIAVIVMRILKGEILPHNV